MKLCFYRHILFQRRNNKKINELFHILACVFVRTCVVCVHFNSLQIEKTKKKKETRIYMYLHIEIQAEAAVPWHGVERMNR